MKKKIIIGLVLIFCLVLFIGGSIDDQTNYNEEDSLKTESQDNEKAETDLTSNYTTEENNCYIDAEDYLNTTSFSKQGLIDQLSSKYGDNYPKKTAEKIVNDIEKQEKISWDKECEEAAQDYLDTMSFSKQGLIDQLCSRYGDNFTKEQAEKAVNKVYK